MLHVLCLKFFVVFQINLLLESGINMVVEGLKSSKFFCLISATSIDTEEFFRHSQIFTLLTPTV